MNELTINLEQSIPDILVGILFLIIAIIAGYIVKNLIAKGAKALKLDQRFGDSAKEANSIPELLGKLGFILTVLFFLPGIFDRFGLNNISAPLTGMLGTFLGYIPRLIGAALLLFLGFVIAKIVQQLTVGFLEKVKVDKLKDRMGLADSKTSEEPSKNTLSFADLGGKVLYVIVLIPFIIAALEVLNIDAITDPAVTMLMSITGIIPQILAAGILILIGIFIAKLVGDLVENIIDGFGLSDKVADVMDEPRATGFDLGRVVGIVVKALIILFFTVQAFDLIGLTIFQTIGGAVIAYLPMILSALLILLGGYILGSVAKRFIVDTLPQARFAAMIIKGVIITISALMALSHLGIGALFVETLFIAIIVASAVAFAIAFGIGGRDFARNTLQKLEKNMEESKGSMKEIQKKLEAEDRLKEAEQKARMDEMRERGPVITEVHHDEEK
ncbi:mechanosensitive ion channel [Proteiniclasticum sp. SCR006]|uniref:Mechanosensitive ion channel n=1 Tax=Proteiniclasticum aestuarii TaxID=2817862 RepID=A0A939KI01_9CLOT|nr:mechanosensitive ion channel [Proteiniclasticum aestuarii]MBO1266099.1 mechanosensitive ion channel [Proteiniclasticum aestuarii]